jgi:ABC-type Fe3+-hydroxamate transport system substrate-binding protein
MKRILSVLVILLLCATVVLAGCSGASTGSATGTSAAAGSAASGSNLVTSPTDSIPDNNAVTVTVQEKVYDGKIPVVFNGGKGQSLVKSIEVTLYTSDGQVKTTNLGINKDDTISLQGTKDPNNPDRVVVHVSEMNGETYKVADVLSTYRQH